MDHQDAVGLVAREADALARLLRPAALAAPVPHCPGWSLADLARHTGGVHRWATAALATPPDGDPGDEPAGPADDAAVPAWFAEGATSLVAALRAAGPESPCWTFAAAEAPATAAFWARRQVHETAVHRWDALAAVAPSTAHPATWQDDDVAADGVAEVADVLLPRQVRLGRLAPLDAAVDLVDARGRRTRLGGQGGGRGGDDAVAVAVVTGSASLLQLLLWRRASLGAAVAAGLAAVEGDAAAASRVLGSALTP